MNKEIKVIIKGEISKESLERYYAQLWSVISEQDGYDTLKQLYDEIYNKL